MITATSDYPGLRHTSTQSSSESRFLLKDLFAKSAEIAQYCSTYAGAIDEQGAFPVREFEMIAEAGLLAVPLLPQWGGLGLGIDSSLMYELLLLLRLIGWGNLAVGRIFEGHVNALQLIQTFGTMEQIEQYAADACDRHHIFGVWNAEANDGVKILPVDKNRFRLEGSKTFCSGAGYVKRPFVNGEMDGRWQMCVVPLEQVKTKDDASWWQPSGMRATASYKIDFSGVELTSESLIGQLGDYQKQPWLSGGAIRFAAAQLGGAEALMDATHQYLQTLGRTDDPFQSTRMGQMAIALESGKLWLKGAADLIADYDPIFGGDPNQPQSAQKADRLVNYVNMSRTAIEQICMDVIQLCERSVGTRGLMPPHSMDRIIRDLTLYLRQPGFDATLQSTGSFALSHSNPISSVWYEASHL
jgi:alkylation response protein AidB-like acyl-CoA dehydrogenase